MKLRNKLIPLTGIAAVAAVATPLALTSCNKSDIQMVDITKGYVPTIEPHVGDFLGTQKTNQEYFGGIKSNGDIFTQDYIYGKWLTWQSYISKAKQLSTPTNIKINSLKTGISTPVFGSVDIAYPGEPSLTYPTISVSFKTEADFDIEVNNTSKFTKTNHVISCTVTYDNMPFYAHVGATNTHKATNAIVGYWNPTIPYMADEAYVYNYNLSDWAIKYDYKQTTKIREVNKGQAATEAEYTNNKSDVINTPAGMYETFTSSSSTDSTYLQTGLTLDYPSYYLSDIVQAPELTSAGRIETTAYAAVDTTGQTGLANVYLGTTMDSLDDNPEPVFSNTPFQMTRAMDSMLDDEEDTITFYADLDSDEKPKGNQIVFNQIDVEEGDTATTLTIGSEATPAVLDISDSKKVLGAGDFSGFYGYASPVAKFGKDKISTEAATKTYKFALPKYIVAKIEVKGHDPIVQKVYLNQDFMTITVNFVSGE